jgi:hypothetical protein
MNRLRIFFEVAQKVFYCLLFDVLPPPVIIIPAVVGHSGQDECKHYGQRKKADAGIELQAEVEPLSRHGDGWRGDMTCP